MKIKYHKQNKDGWVATDHEGKTAPIYKKFLKIQKEGSTSQYG